MRNGSCSTTIWTHLVNDEVENVKKARWSGPMEQAVSLFGIVHRHCARERRFDFVQIADST